MCKWLLTLLLMVSTHVQAYDCFPSTWVPTPGLGTPYRTVTETFGYAKSWWCTLPARQGDVAGKKYYAPQIFAVHNSDQNLTAFTDALQRVAAAPDPLRQANIEVATANVKLDPGSQKEYEYAVLRYKACNDLKANPPDGVTFDPIPDNWCGAAPVPPIQTVRWLTASIVSYYTSSSGLTATAGIIQRGLLCDCTTPLKIGTVTYCTFAGAQTPLVRTSCTKQ